MKILLAVTGSISAYKSIDLARALVNSNHEVKIILTKGALQFVIPKVFTYLGVQEVYESDQDFKEKGVLHVELARWSDKLIIAPLSANTLSRIVRGEASDLLTSIFLAYEKTKPILVFPAMNSEMLSHPFVENNFNELKKLKSLNNIYIAPTGNGKLACNDEGQGKLLTIEEIKELIETITINLVNQKNFLITTGATLSPLDPVRYLTNSSSGITGFFLAHAFLSLGHNVTVIAGKNSTEKLNYFFHHPHFKLVKVSTVSQMNEAVHQNISTANYFISSAAVSDIELEYTNSKIKKSDLKNTLSITSAKDILKSVLDLKLTHLVTVGFAAETDLSLEVLTQKFNSKPVNLLIGTKVHNGLTEEKTIGFNNEDADYKFMKNSKIVFEGNLTKKLLGFEILKRLQND
jgi:phosphopantothenoylcysteine decarboxylase/phosphopantothenate--cysteine ligase